MSSYTGSLKAKGAIASAHVCSSILSNNRSHRFMSLSSPCVFDVIRGDFLQRQIFRPFENVSTPKFDNSIFVRNELRILRFGPGLHGLLPFKIRFGVSEGLFQLADTPEPFGKRQIRKPDENLRVLGISVFVRHRGLTSSPITDFHCTR